MTADPIGILADPVAEVACRQCRQPVGVEDLAPFSIFECPHCHARQPVPARLGHFLLLELLGAGGMGAVYQAFDQSLGRYVAIKVMKPMYGADPKFVENFLREARAAAALNHPHVVQIYACGQEQNQPYIVMELVSGGRMDELMAPGRPLDELQTLQIALDVAKGLQAANDIGLVHGDVKPANVLFDKNNRAKLADFGLASFAKWQDTAPGEIWGTPYYLAPEKARGIKADHRSDIYSLGATLYHGLAAKPPFEGSTAAEVVLARLKGPAIPLSSLRPGLHAATQAVVMRMLEADPFRRYPTYKSLIGDLREALEALKQAPASGIHSLPKKKSSGLRVGMAITGGLVMLGAGLGLWWGLKGKPGAPEPGPSSSPVPVKPAPRPAPAGEPVAAPAPMPVQPLLLQPFTGKDEDTLLEIFALLQQDRPAAMQERLAAFSATLPPDGTAKCWALLLQAMPCWIIGSDQDAREFLTQARQLPLAAWSDTTQPNPAQMPRTLAAYLMGEATADDLRQAGVAGAAWFQELQPLFAAIPCMQRGEWSAADEHLRAYTLSTPPAAPRWPYALRSLAEQWRAALALAQQKQAEAEALLNQNKPAEARELLESLLPQTPQLMRPLVDAALARARAEERRLEEIQAAAARQAHEAAIQNDLDALDKVRTTNWPLIQAQDYRAAIAASRLVNAELQTEEGRQALANQCELYEQMDTLRKMLIARLASTPLPPQVLAETGWQVTSANMNGLQIALGQHGTMVRPWAEVGVRPMVLMASYYLSDTQTPPTDRAAGFLALAAYCHGNGGTKLATTHALQAIQLNPELKTTVLRLMPGLIE